MKKRRPNRARRLIAYLRRRGVGGATPWMIMNSIGVVRYGAAVHEARHKEGAVIKIEVRRGVTVYRLVQGPR